MDLYLKEGVATLIFFHNATSDSRCTLLVEARGKGGGNVTGGRNVAFYARILERTLTNFTD